MIKIGHSHRSIYKEKWIDLYGLDGALLLQATFDRYLLGWITQTLGSYNLTLVWESLYHSIASLTTPRDRVISRHDEQL